MNSYEFFRCVSADALSKDTSSQPNIKLDGEFIRQLFQECENSIFIYGGDLSEFNDKRLADDILSILRGKSNTVEIEVVCGNEIAGISDASQTATNPFVSMLQEYRAIGGKAHVVYNESDIIDQIASGHVHAIVTDGGKSVWIQFPNALNADNTEITELYFKRNFDLGNELFGRWNTYSVLNVVETGDDAFNRIAEHTHCHETIESISRALNFSAEAEFTKLYETRLEEKVSALEDSGIDLSFIETFLCKCDE